MNTIQSDNLVNLFCDNSSITENGALGYATTLHPLLDMNFKVSSFRDRSEQEITEEFIKAFYSDRKYSVKWLFFLRDILEGLGERRTFRVCLRYLAVSHPQIVRAVLDLVPEYGRFDDVLILLDTPLRKEASAMMLRQIYKDLEGMRKKQPISLLAKWLPSINASSKETRRIAEMLVEDFGMSPRIYRKILAELRQYLDVVEVKITDNKWSEIDYEKVPAKASLKYDEAFERHDAKRREEYLEQILLGKAKLNAKGLVPHEIVHKMLNGGYAGALRDNKLCELMWKCMMEQGFQNEWGLDNCIVVADGSGSMYAPVDGNNSLRAIEVCNALAIYFAQQLKGIYHDKAITFSEHPNFIDLAKGTTLKEKLEILFAHNEIANTNIEAVFDLLLRSAMREKISADELPKQVLIISDMEFDMARGRYGTSVKYNLEDERLFQKIEQKYHRAGYPMPRLIFWNVCGRTDTIPMVSGENGVCLLSGFSQNAVKVASSKEIDPYESLRKTLDSPRYDKVEEVLYFLKYNGKQCQKKIDKIG